MRPGAPIAKSSTPATLGFDLYFPQCPTTGIKLCGYRQANEAFWL